MEDKTIHYLEMENWKQFVSFLPISEVLDRKEKVSKILSEVVPIEEYNFLKNWNLKEVISKIKVKIWWVF